MLENYVNFSQIMAARKWRIRSYSDLPEPEIQPS